MIQSLIIFSSFAAVAVIGPAKLNHANNNIKNE